jgi:hypothetical protein
VGSGKRRAGDCSDFAERSTVCVEEPRRGLEGDGGSADCCVAVEAEASAPVGRLRRLRPPRRPRRRGPCSVAGVAEPEDVAELEVSAAEEDSVEANVSKTAAFWVKGRPGSGIKMDGCAALGTAGEVKWEGASPALSGGRPPKRVAASCALVFQSARRKRSAAVEYHFAASAFCPEVSR